MKKLLSANVCIAFGQPPAQELTQKVTLRWSVPMIGDWIFVKRTVAWISHRTTRTSLWQTGLVPLKYPSCLVTADEEGYRRHAPCSEDFISLAGSWEASFPPLFRALPALQCVTGCSQHRDCCLPGLFWLHTRKDTAHNTALRREIEFFFRISFASAEIGPIIPLKVIWLFIHSTNKILNSSLPARNLLTEFIAGFVSYKYQFNKANWLLVSLLSEQLVESVFQSEDKHFRGTVIWVSKYWTWLYFSSRNSTREKQRNTRNILFRYFS